MPRLADFDNEVKGMGAILVQATIHIFKNVLEQFLPTPDKCHYLFNMRDMSRVIQGLLQADKKYVDTRESVLRLWVHETCRVYYDRMINAADKEKFRNLMDQALSSSFELRWRHLMSELEEPEEGPVFCSFLDKVVGEEERPYEEVCFKD